ncbi:leucine-%2C glutamate- and lysine-rich protein 1 [Scomber scombrus]|uniref:Leucine-, glutamate- and lysine-rich protein 1 n=1 Tax=Scomber scombrus TaxID=13677 RepID=A0AAV1P1E4_SCOSC
MGDEERYLEAKQEEEKEMKMVFSCPPIHPLPEEIKKMERSETVCSYCGVSYLIFHEFHQLQTRLADLEAELQELAETSQREKAQREALEMGRLEWERTLHQDVQRKAEEKEKHMKEEQLEAERVLRKGFEQTIERRRKEMEEEYQKISEEKAKQLRQELGDLEAERLRRQQEELERRIGEREKVLIDALQKANKNSDELRKYLQQLEERLAIAASTKEEAERLLRKEKRQGEIVRCVCVQQQQALRTTLSVLRSSGSELTHVRGFLGQLMGAWQAFRSQILQHSTQVFSVLRDELKHSSVKFQKMREVKEHLTQQLMLKGDLEEKHERWLSCQQRCDTLQEQLLSWQHREEQMNRKSCAADGEVTRLGEDLERVRQETRELRRERKILIESHGRALTKMEADYRQRLSSKLAAALEKERTQNALHLREKMEELRREVELQLTIDREKSQLLLLQYQRDSTQLQQKLEERERQVRALQEEQQEDWRCREEERRTLEEWRRREEEIQQNLQRSVQQEALHLSQAKAELQLMTERNAELQEEAALLQDTVRRECEEREELTAVLCQAQQELLRLRSPVSHQGSSKSPAYPPERHTLPGNNHFHLHSQARIPLTRSSASPNTLWPSSACTDKDRGRGTDGGGAGRSLDSWNGNGVLGGEKRREGTLPRLKASSTVSEVKRKVSLVMGRKQSE